MDPTNPEISAFTDLTTAYLAYCTANL